jgi:hypothetical protein
VPSCPLVKLVKLTHYRKKDQLGYQKRLREASASERELR